VKVEACGIRYSDLFVKEGLWPGIKYPRVLGRKIGGVSMKSGPIYSMEKGQRMGVGWHGGYDFVCPQCRSGDFAMCVNRKVTGIDFDGGYARIYDRTGGGSGCGARLFASTRDRCASLH
jgi:D-arabinose 1-dehydrogenase-like Zn-dependent alcohol dehydrogenase